MHSLPQEPLARALEEALAGKPRALSDFLARSSWLPGQRANDALADALAALCASRGSRCDAVALALAGLSADEAPGATALEFLPVCGIAALAARASTDAAVRAAFLGELHAHADDRRFRVREAVVAGLAKIGAVAGEGLVDSVASWMDGYFHAAAVVSALSRSAWLGALHDAAAALGRLDDAFLLARDAPRSAARYPGRKELVVALQRAVGPIALRFGVPAFDLLARWSTVQDPELRELIERSLADKRLGGRYGTEVERVRRALLKSAPAVRNPDHDVGRTRDRSGSRRRKR